MGKTASSTINFISSMKNLKLKDGDVLRRQCVGIDVSKDKLTFCLCQNTEKDQHFYSKPMECKNTEEGFEFIIAWSGKEVDDSAPYSFLMETTGCYHESLAIHLASKGLTVHVVHANKAKDFARLNGCRTKTDPVDSRMLARMGCDTSGLEPWPLPDEKYLRLREMSRFDEQMEKSLTQTKCWIEAVKHSGIVDKEILSEHKKMLKSTKALQKKNRSRMEKLVAGDESLSKDVENMASIKGIGKKTAILVMAETLGFHQMTSAKQVASYAGLDVRREQSGKVDKKGRITKKGNAHLRAALYFPAMVASWSNPQLKEDYERICRSHTQSKMIALVALERKLLCLMYAVRKSGKSWDPEYGKVKSRDGEEEGKC